MEQQKLSLSFVLFYCIFFFIFNERRLEVSNRLLLFSTNLCENIRQQMRKLVVKQLIIHVINPISNGEASETFRLIIILDWNSILERKFFNGGFYFFSMIESIVLF